jgi:hypothetical protein
METTPLWLRLLGEVQAKANRNVLHWHPPARHPIDYSYVRPQHISSINSLCREFFYPGIDCKYTCTAAVYWAFIKFVFKVCAKPYLLNFSSVLIDPVNTHFV